MYGRNAVMAAVPSDLDSSSDANDTEYEESCSSDDEGIRSPAGDEQAGGCTSGGGEGSPAPGQAEVGKVARGSGAAGTSGGGKAPAGTLVGALAAAAAAGKGTKRKLRAKRPTAADLAHILKKMPVSKAAADASLEFKESRLERQRKHVAVPLGITEQRAAEAERQAALHALTEVLGPAVGAGIMAM